MKIHEYKLSELDNRNESAATTEKYNKRIIFLAVNVKSAYNESVGYAQSHSFPLN
jgi:hypothetical protein